MGSSSHTAPAFLRLAAHPVRWRLLSELAHSDLRVRELVTLLGQPQNLVSYHLRRLRDGGLVTAARSSFDGRDSYYHLDIDRCAEALAGTGAALHPALSLVFGPAVNPDASPAINPHASPALNPDASPAVNAHGRRRRLTVLFVCTGNSARSPIAEALLRRDTTESVEVTSAGTQPKAQLHPTAVRVLRKRFGIDIGAQRPKDLGTLTGRRFDYVITLCDKAREACPGFDGHPHRLHWSIPDPAKAEYPAFTRAADDIQTRVRHLLPVLAIHDKEMP